MYQNIAESGLNEATNMSYLVYPIMILNQETGQMEPKFPNSLTIANLLTAIRIMEYDNGPAADPTDWKLLNTIFTGFRPGTEVNNQFWLNELASPEAAHQQLRDWLAEFGYTPAQIDQAFELADSAQVAEVIAAGRVAVREEIRTVTIPTLLTPGRMHRGLVEVDTLRGLVP
jgi:hypothetical protein